MCHKVLFIATIREGLPPRGGAEAKNKVILKKLQNQLRGDLSYLDVSTLSLAIFIKLFWAIITHKTIVFSIANTALQKLAYLNFIFKNKSIIIIVVGGLVHEKLKNDKKLKLFYENAKYVYAQTETLCDNIKNISQDINVLHLPNFKPIPKVNLIDKKNTDEDIRLVYLSRIEPAKGIFRTLELVAYLNSYSNRNFFLDIYGPMDLDKQDQFKFDEQLKENEYASYKGFLDLSDSEGYRKLSKYHFFIFLTNHPGEGLPGVLIDAMIAQVPVIASDWAYNKEIVPENNLLVNLDNLKYHTTILDYINLILSLSTEDYNSFLSSLNYESQKYNESNIRIKI